MMCQVTTHMCANVNVYMHVCVHAFVGGVCECYCLCVHVCVCLASVPLQISNAPFSAPQQVPLGASGGDTASAVNMSGCCRVEEEIPASSCSVSISHFSVPRVTLMVRKEVILSHCLPQRFVLRRLIFSGRINSSPRWSLKATPSRYVCGLLCDLRVCPQGFSHVLFWLQTSSVSAMQKGSNTEASRGGTASANPRTAEGTAKSPWEWQLT